MRQAAQSRVIEANSDVLQRIAKIEKQLESVGDPDSVSMVIFSGELDKLLAAFVIATGAAACGMKVNMFFTFWGTAALKKCGPQAPNKSVIERMFGWMLPGGFHNRKLSKMDMGGLGRRFMMREMNKKNVPDLGQLIDIAKMTNVQIDICEMSMSLMGIHKEELIEYPNTRYCGVATFLEAASKSGTTLFI